MKRSFGLFALCGFAITGLLGTFLHYLYEWSGESKLVAPFSGVNESTFEHMKLLFVPMLIYALIQSLYFKDREDFWCIKLRSITLGLIMIPILFYTYNGAIGKSPDWLNISIFFISAAIAYIYEVKEFKRSPGRCKHKGLALLTLFAIALLFIVFTFKTPALGIFIDPLTGRYGI
jgi:hypothetical protein